MDFPCNALAQRLLERLSFSESEPILAPSEILIRKLTAILTEENFLLPHLPHRCHQGSKPCGKFELFCAEWLPLLPDGAGIFWIHSCKTGGGKYHNIIIARILCLNLPFLMHILFESLQLLS